MDQLEPYLLAHLEAVTQLDVEVSERFNPAGVLKRSGIYGVKTDILANVHDLLLGILIMTRHKERERHSVYLPGVQVLREDRIECLYRIK